MSQLDLYDGTINLLDHFGSYKALMQVQGATNGLLYITFLTTLRKEAQVSYFQLKPRSINSFKQLKKKFVAYFDTCQKMPHEANSFFFICQQNGEFLRDYVARFKLATLKVYNPDEFMAMLAMKRELHTLYFTYSLNKKPPKFYAELLTCMQKHIRASEADSTRRKIDERHRRKQVRGELSRAQVEKANSSY